MIRNKNTHRILIRTFPKVLVKTEQTTNENDPKSSKAVAMKFYNKFKRLVGEASVSAVDTDDAFLYDVEVFEPFRGKGFGRSIIRYCLKHYNITTLTVEPSNIVAIHLYKTFGFFKDGTWRDDGNLLIIMRRNLPS